MLGIWTLVIIRPPISDLFDILFLSEHCRILFNLCHFYPSLVCSCVFVNAVYSVLNELVLSVWFFIDQITSPDDTITSCRLYEF